ncbi:betaine--homocysteine S-methyltransferase [Coralliovum pocilloporae]|uniref:betaine--homocysteine S-methyltransferase n=1 Tax=Coralliovum pocilloporae TaxID=3066369 RepID=UPI0033078697
MSKLQDLITEKGVLLADGATGTNFFGMGLESGNPPEEWNLTLPENVKRLHRGFIEAGSDIILTNTFGGNRHRLKLHAFDNQVAEINKAAVRIAQEVAAEVDRTVIIAGSIGPTGELLAPLGELTYEGAVDAFREQMVALKEAGADALWVETMSSPEEMKAAAEAADGLDIPFVLTASFDTAGKTMMGLSPKGLGDLTKEFKCEPVAIGSNCGVGASDLLAAISELTAAYPDIIVVAKANCGIPQVSGDSVIYTGTPELMEDYVRLAIDVGARIIGGCCGTACEHLSRMRYAMDHHERGPRPSNEVIAARTGPFVANLANSNSETEGQAQPRRRRAGGRRRSA